MLTGFVATLLAALAIQTGGVHYKPFIRGYEDAGSWVVSEYFIGVEWPCRAGGGALRRSDEQCYAGWEYGFDDAAGFVTGP